MENEKIKTITINAYDLTIRETTDKEGRTNEYVAFRNAFDEDFIEAMRERGVKKFVKREEEEDEDEE